MAAALIRQVTPQKRAAFLEALRETGNVVQAAKRFDMSTQHFYAHRRTDPEFKAAWDQALQDAIETVLEPEALRRAVTGVEEPVYQGGVQVGTVRKYSDTLLIFLMKGAKPEKYRDNHRSGAQMDVSELLKAVLLELADRRDARDVTPEADWAPLPPRERLSTGNHGALPMPPAVGDADDEEEA